MRINFKKYVYGNGTNVGLWTVGYITLIHCILYTPPVSGGVYNEIKYNSTVQIQIQICSSRQSHILRFGKLALRNSQQYLTAFKMSKKSQSLF